MQATAVTVRVPLFDLDGDRSTPASFAEGATLREAIDAGLRQAQQIDPRSFSDRGRVFYRSCQTK